MNLDPMLRRLWTLAIAALSVAAAPLMAEDAEPELGWSKEAELSLVTTAGNAESETFGTAASFVKTMPSATLELSANGLRAESTSTQRQAIGPDPTSFSIVETSTSTLTAEQLTLRGRYDRQLTDAFFWYTALSWERNEFAGFSERWIGVGGVGNQWWKDDGSRFRTDYGITFTQQDDLVANSSLEDSFLGLRGSYDYWRKLGTTTTLGSTLVVDQNLDESSDLRADFTNWLSVSMSERLALKVSLRALYDNLPAQGSLGLEFPAGAPTGDTVLFDLDTLDTVFTTALVVSF